MSPEVFSKTLENVLTCELPHFLHEDFLLCWHECEPLTLPIAYYKEQLALLAEARNKYDPENKIRIRLAMQSNATLVTEEWCQFLKENNIRIGVSIDGPDFLNNERRNFSGKPAFNAILSGIRLLKQHKLLDSTICVVRKETLAYAHELATFFLKEQIPFIGLNIDEASGANNHSSFVEASQVDYERFLKIMWQYYLTHKKNLRIREFEEALGLICETEANLINNLLVKPFSYITVGSSGDFSTFCPELLTTQSERFKTFVFGNVLTSRFEDILEDKAFQSVYQEIQAGVSLCQQTCEYFDFCGGGYPSNKFTEKGRFDVAETKTCEIVVKSVWNVVIESLINQDSKEHNSSLPNQALLNVV